MLGTVSSAAQRFEPLDTEIQNDADLKYHALTLTVIDTGRSSEDRRDWLRDSPSEEIASRLKLCDEGNVVRVNTHRFGLERVFSSLALPAWVA